MSYINKIIEHVENLSTLEIRTVVGNFTWDKDERQVTYIDEEAKVIITQINLVDGDITTAFSGDFLKWILKSIKINYSSHIQNLEYELKISGQRVRFSSF